MKHRKHWFILPAALLLLGAAIVSAGATGAVVGQNAFLLTAMDDPGARGRECTLGDAAADALRYAAETDVALLPGGVFAFNLLGGDVTEEDVARVFPGNDPLGTAVLTTDQLRRMLERSVASLVIGETERVDWDRSRSDGFLQVSGLRFRFDVSNPPGERVTELTLDDGRGLPPDGGTVTAVGTAALFAGEYGDPAVAYTPLDDTLPEAFIRYLGALDGPLQTPADGRIEMYGTVDTAFLSGVRSSAVLFLACAGAIALAGLLTFGRSAAWRALKDRTMPVTEEEKNSVLERFMKR